jgi:MscS family membrane protein
MAFACSSLLRLHLLLLALLVGCSVSAQPTPAPHASTPTDAGDTAPEGEREEVVARDSPRASIADFFARCREGDYETAATYLELTERTTAAEGAQLARRLKAVLDRRLWVEIDVLSPLPGGNADDGLPPYTDELGRIESRDRALAPVRIVRRRREGSVRWMFSSATVSRIDPWYEALEGRWVLEHLPAKLLATGPRALMWWQWLSMPALVGFSLLVAMGLSLLTARTLGSIAASRLNVPRERLVERLKRPLTLFWTLGIAYALLPWLGLYEPAEDFVLSMMSTFFLIGVFWVLARAVDVGAQMIFRSPWGLTHQASRALVSLGSRVTKIALMSIAAVALLSQLGYPIASILAGLGVGGLAVALAAQKTVENLFGAFSIGADQPFREGDLVRVDNFVATVELIGLRSTKFRTLDRTLISIPNGKLADMKLETFAVRDRLRFAMTLGLSYATTSGQLREVIDGLSRLLSEHPKLWDKSAGVRFEKFGPSSLDLDVSAFFDTRDWGEFTTIREELLLQFMAVIERAGTSLALPASTVQVMPRSMSSRSNAATAPERPS